MSILSVGAKHVTKALAKEAVPEVLETAAKTAVKTAPDVAPKAVATNLDFLTKGRTKKQALEIIEKHRSYGFDINDPDYLEADLPQSIENVYNNAAGGNWNDLSHTDQLSTVDRMYGNGSVVPNLVQEHGERTLPPPRDPVEALRANYAPREPEEAIESLRGMGGQNKWGRTDRTIQGPVPPRLTDKTFDQGAESWEGAIMSGTTKFTQGDDPFQVRNFGAAYAPRGQTTKVGTRKTTGRGITKEGNTRKINEELATADWIKPEEQKAFGKAMAQAASEGMDGDHIIEVARVANAVRDLTPAKREAYFKIFENAGIHLGNHPKNIQKLSKELNQVVKPAEIRELDNALRSMDKRGKTLLEDIIFTPKAEPNWTGIAKKAIDGQIGKSGWDEARWRSANTQFTWSKADNRGYIDIIKDTAGDDAVGTLKAQFFKEIDKLPSGTTWTLEADTAQKYRIYKRMFRDDPRIKPGGDEKLLAERGIDHFVLTIP
jgi:hypothetical protein